MILVRLTNAKLRSPNQKTHHMAAYLENKRLVKRVRCHFLAHKSFIDELKFVRQPESPTNIEKSTAVKKPAKISILYIHPRAAQLDDDNLVSSCKGLKDALADLLRPGLNPGMADGDKTLEWHYSQKKGQPKEYTLEITIEKI